MKNRIKSFVWRAGGMSFIAGGAYVLKIGDLWKVDPKLFVNIAVLAALGLAVGEVTKMLNTK